MKRRAFAELIKRIVRRSKLESILLASTVIFGIIGIIVVPNILGKSIWTSLMGLIGGACIGLLGFLFGGLAVWKFYDDIMKIKQAMRRWKSELKEIEQELEKNK